MSAGAVVCEHDEPQPACTECSEPEAPILRATAWADNASLIADAFRLIGATDPHAGLNIVDLTWGRGAWWNNLSPEFDVDGCDKDYGHDFRHIPEIQEGSADIVAYDPPYIAPGGRTSSTVADMNDRYGIDDCPTTHSALMRLVIGGLCEAARICAPQGFVLAKCMPYVTSGELRDVPTALKTVAPIIGLKLFDELVHVSGTGPQPQRDRQVHARANTSNLLIFRKARK